MSPEEAVKFLQTIANNFLPKSDWGNFEENPAFRQSIDLAIAALSGEHVSQPDLKNKYYYCSTSRDLCLQPECGLFPKGEHVPVKVTLNAC